MKQVRMSMKPVLPSLRPVSPAVLSDTPRGIKPPSKLGVPLRYSSDFDVNRSLFSHSPRQKKLLPPASGADKATSSSTDALAVGKPVTEPPTPYNGEEVPYNQTPPDLQLIEEMVKRIPDLTLPNSTFDAENVFTITPALDRILCITQSWTPENVKEYSSYPIIDTLQHRLFALIDVNDFLLRTIICRIILCFALDSSSSLLLPVARIFYKLSCTNVNDPFFYEENIDDVLFALLENQNVEVQVFAAAAIKNISSYLPMADRLATSNILDIVMDIITANGADDTLKVQMIGTVKAACKSSMFKVKLQKSKLLGRAAADPVLFNDVLRTIPAVPTLPADEKVKITSFLPKKDISEESDIDLATKSFLILAKGIEDQMECANAALYLIKKTNSYPEHQLALLQVAARCCEAAEALIPIFEKDPDKTIIGILTSEERDMELGIAALAIVKTYKDLAYDQIKEDYEARFSF